MKSQFIKVSPSFNKTVIFSTTDFSYHGHPDPLRCPDSVSRKSLALYYYSNSRPSKEVKFHKSTSTNYQERPEENFSGNKKIFKMIKKLIPPILIDLYNRMR